MSEKYDFDKVTSRDRINYPYILACRLLSIQEAEKSGDTLNIEGSILGLLSDIPDGLRDSRFNQEKQDSQYTIWEDKRKTWGGVPQGLQIFKDNPRTGEKANQIETTYYDHDELKHACINLLFRKNMLTREVLTQKFPGPIPIISSTKK